MRDEIITTLQQMIEMLTGGYVVIGSLPPLNAYSLSFAGGNPRTTFRTLKNSDQELPVQFNGKSTDQRQLAANMEKVHQALTTSAALPFSANWQIYAIETTSAPQLIGREENRNYIYGSSFRIKFYTR